ncbi:MAG: hypothetical protein SOZ96_12975 [Treponema sp.]|nr:hypothetical protein [Treponema sp.]
MNITLTIILVLIAIIATLAGVISITVKKNKKLKTENKQLSDKIGQLNTNIAFLVKHSQELAQIHKEKEKTFERIEEARTDEEIADIVSIIINSNNQRVQNMPEN